MGLPWNSWTSLHLGEQVDGTFQFPHLTVFNRLYRTVDIIQHFQQRTVRIVNVARVVRVVRTVRITRIIRVVRTKRCHQFVHAPILVNSLYASCVFGSGEKHASVWSGPDNSGNKHVTEFY